MLQRGGEALVYIVVGFFYVSKILITLLNAFII